MALRIACDLDGTLADMESALQQEAERLFGPDVDLRARGHVVVEVEDEREGEGRLKAAPTTAAGAGPGAGAAASTVAATSTDAARSAQAARTPATATPAAAGDAGRKQTRDEGRRKPESAQRKAGTASRKKPLNDRQMRDLWAHVRGIENFWTRLKEIEPGAVSKLAALSAAHGWEVIFLTQRPATAGDTAQVQSQWWLYEHGFRFPSVYVMNGSRGKVATALHLDAVVDDRPENCLDVVTDSSARSILIWRDDPSLVPAASARLGITVVHSFADALEDLQHLMARREAPRGLLGRLRSAIGV